VRPAQLGKGTGPVTQTKTLPGLRYPRRHTRQKPGPQSHGSSPPPGRLGRDAMKDSDRRAAERVGSSPSRPEVICAIASSSALP
jgi:hypothetical protein